MNKEKFRFYKDYPKTCSPNDFWGQVKRTVNGNPVSQDQIDMIVDVVVAELDLSQEDSLLDLCCGNGALSTLFFKKCNGGLGVDFSEYLISIADKYFASPPYQTYICQDALEFCQNPTTPDKFTKVVCYGSFSYLEQVDAEKLLSLLNKNFPNIQRVFIGNCPDKDLLSDFFSSREFTDGVENEPDSPVGIWRSTKEFVAMAKQYGWKPVIHQMPSTYYAAHYRYDVILTHD